jgi:polysaccharide export outer membrane protein
MLEGCMSRWGFCLALFFLSVPLFSCASEQIVQTPDKAHGAPPAAAQLQPDSDASVSKNDVQPESSSDVYRIDKGDVLEINVWKEPVISGPVTVRKDGMISINLIGDVQAAGSTTMELKDVIQKKLAEFVANPTVSVIVKSSTNKKYYVVGEVKNSGEYELDKNINVIQAIARAGGFAEWADKSRIVIIRKENDVEKRIKINFKEIVKGNDDLSNMQIKAGDTIVVQ